jgi:hypothetical protein
VMNFPNNLALHDLSLLAGSTPDHVFHKFASTSLTVGEQ